MEKEKERRTRRCPCSRSMRDGATPSRFDSRSRDTRASTPSICSTLSGRDEPKTFHGEFVKTYLSLISEVANFLPRDSTARAPSPRSSSRGRENSPFPWWANERKLGRPPSCCHFFPNSLARKTWPLPRRANGPVPPFPDLERETKSSLTLLPPLQRWCDRGTLLLAPQRTKPTDPTGSLSYARVATLEFASRLLVRFRDQGTDLSLVVLAAR